MKQTKEVILPCPFCGGTKVEIARTNPFACWVECCRCGARSNSDHRRKVAIRIWNKRNHKIKPVKIMEDDDVAIKARADWQGEGINWKF